MQPIKNAITEGRLINLEGLSKDEVLKTLSFAIEKSKQTPPELDIYKSILDREMITNTYLGFNIACPHTRIPWEGEILCSIGWNHEGILYNSATNDSAKLVFLFIIPKNKSNEYLNMIASLIKFLMKFEKLRDFENIYDLNAIQSRILEWIYIIENPENDEIDTISAHANMSLIIDMILPDIKELIEAKRFSKLQKFINEQDSVEIAEIMNCLNIESSTIIFRILSKSKAEEIFSLLESEAQNNLINNLAKEEIVR